jgi:regulator of protease activity HflC (stomatin/prohibitin superfamily)
LEATTVTVKESFYKESEDNDHRVNTLDGNPLSVDIYIQIALPETDEGKNETFNSITPKTDSNNSRIFIIKLQDVYNQFAQMIIRGKVREIFAKYTDAKAIKTNYNKVNAEIGLMVADVVKISKTPISLISVQLSNVQEDKIILTSKNKISESQNESDAIEKIGATLRKYPEYLEFLKIKMYEKATDKASTINFMISDQKNQQYSIPFSNK